MPGAPDLGPNLFSLDASREAIDALRALDLGQVSIDDLKVRIWKVIAGYMMKVDVLNPGTPLCRASPCERPAHVSRLLYPPALFCKENRANREGSPLFYSSASPLAAAYEVHAQVGQTIVISHWKTTARLVTNNAGFSFAALKRLGSRRAEGFAEPREEPGGPVHALVTDFLADVFATPGVERYKLSIAIAEVLIGQDMFHGLLYPSIAMYGNADNLAIKPDFVDRSVAFVKAELHHIDEVRDDGLASTILDTAKELADDGTIVWRGRAYQWVVTPDRPLRLTAEECRWVVRDPTGTIIEPD